MKKFEFKKAKPVWAKGREEEKNYSVIVRSVLPKGEAKLSAAGHSDFQVIINGKFFSQGPARTGHGFFRVDELELGGALTEERNVLCVLVAGYNVNSYYLTHQAPFVCAEVEIGGEVVFASGAENDFEYYHYADRVQKVQRYSFQRPFVECYDYSADYDLIFTDPGFEAAEIEMASAGEKRFIRHETLPSDYEERHAKRVLAKGVAVPSNEKREFHDWSLDDVNETTIKGFRREELEICSVEELYAFDFKIGEKTDEPFTRLSLPENGFAMLDMGLNTTGYIRLRVKPEKDAVVWVIFNETLYADLPVPDHDACEVRWALEGGREYDLFSFEPYTYRYIQVFSSASPAEVSVLSQYAEHYPSCGLKNLIKIDDAELQKIYDAAVETFRQNATDIFMDCPSRERAGWLCDSFFTSRTERALTGESRIEKAFLENFILPEKFPYIPDGVLPMCYPSEEPGAGYIPNWAMWYLIELSEYYKRTGDRELIDMAKERMYKLAAFFEKYENENGLLEKLESWVFVEWSKANDFVQDVNYPTNMLYSRFLRELGGLYGDEELLKKSEKLAETIRELAFDGEYFVDNALLVDGKLVNTTNHTETAQYYAFHTGVVSRETFPELYDHMLNHFGSNRDPKWDYITVPPSNAFIGNFLRLDIMFENGEYEALLCDIRKFFLPMAEKTGTLWEHMNDGASCNHGFASHVAYWLNALRAKGVI